MTRLIVVRHGESEGNLAKEFHGQYNSDITEKGHAQAECTAEYLKDVHIDKIYSSDIRRAFSTALHTAEKHGLSVIPDEKIREIKAGEWEKMSFAVIPEKYPKEYDTSFNHKSECRCPGGESVKELAARIKAEFRKIVEENDGKTVAVFSHATPICVMCTEWKGQDISAMDTTPWVPNASVSIIDCEKDGSYKIEKLGFAEHLVEKGLLTTLPKNI